MDDENLKRELSEIMNTNGTDVMCSTPDYPLAEYLAAYLIDCLESFKKLNDDIELDMGYQLK
jgi:hypothetical protein